jgi:hypothetical protein
LASGFNRASLQAQKQSTTKFKAKEPITKLQVQALLTAKHKKKKKYQYHSKVSIVK